MRTNGFFNKKVFDRLIIARATHFDGVIVNGKEGAGLATEWASSERGILRESRELLCARHTDDVPAVDEKGTSGGRFVQADATLTTECQLAGKIYILINLEYYFDSQTNSRATRPGFCKKLSRKKNVPNSMGLLEFGLCVCRVRTALGDDGGHPIEVTDGHTAQCLSIDGPRRGQGNVVELGAKKRVDGRVGERHGAGSVLLVC